MSQNRLQDRAGAAGTPSIETDSKTLRDALHRAVAEARGHRGALFKSDGDLIESYIASVPELAAP